MPGLARSVVARRAEAGTVRILAVVDGHRVTGPARQILALADAQHERGLATTSIAVFQRGAAATPLVAAVRAASADAIVLHERFVCDPRMIRALGRWIAATATDVVETHGYKANILASLLARRYGKPWIAFIHGETWDKRRLRPYFAIERVAIRHAGRVVVMSRAMIDAVHAKGVPRERIRVLHNACLDIPESPRALADAAEPVIAVIGRLSPEKGADIALAVLARVRRIVPRARLLVVGEGPERTTLGRQADQLGVADAVGWLGYRDDVRAIYREADVVLVPSRSEGLPNVVLEAMGHGVPVVATAVGGVPELVVHACTGYLAPTGDVEALAAATSALLRDRELSAVIGRNARRLVTERFSLAARRDAMQSIVTEVLG